MFPTLWDRVTPPGGTGFYAINGSGVYAAFTAFTGYQKNASLTSDLSPIRSISRSLCTDVLFFIGVRNRLFLLFLTVCVRGYGDSGMIKLNPQESTLARGRSTLCNRPSPLVGPVGHGGVPTHPLGTCLPGLAARGLQTPGTLVGVPPPSPPGGYLPSPRVLLPHHPGYTSSRVPASSTWSAVSAGSAGPAVRCGGGL